jgi:hypothetical protein
MASTAFDFIDNLNKDYYMSNEVAENTQGPTHQRCPLSWGGKTCFYI